MYKANEARYQTMPYKRLGRSGLKVPAIALGLWEGMGLFAPYENTREMVLGAFDLGVTYFDLANNYGPPAGGAETVFGQIMKNDLMPYRDEMLIATKAGHRMWEGPYGDGGSRKYLLSSLDQSLKRMNLDYVDIFYHHRPDTETPMEESLTALADAVKSGKALYAGISKYSPEDTQMAAAFLRDQGVPLLVHQMRYNLLSRDMENGLKDTLMQNGIGGVAFSPLAQGILTGKYLNGIPEDSRAASKSPFLRPEQLTPDVLKKVQGLSRIADARGQTMAQFALNWVLNSPAVQTAIMGASRLSQIRENVKTVETALPFTPEELQKISDILAE